MLSHLYDGFTLQVYHENAQKLNSIGEIMNFEGVFQCGIKPFSTLYALFFKDR